jgi:tetratricopeptide (TPR) repeat protein
MVPVRHTDGAPAREDGLPAHTPGEALDLAHRLTPSASPRRRQAVRDAIAAIQAGAAAGDGRLQRAYDLLTSCRVAEAEALLQEVAEDKARIAGNSTGNSENGRKAAAAAYRNLAAFALLHRGFETAVAAYDKVLEFEPDDLASLCWSSFALLRRKPEEAEVRLMRALALAGGSESGRFWLPLVLMTLGDVHIRNRRQPEALKLFRDGLAAAEREAQSDPDNAVWQHDLSIAHDRIGDALAAQGDLPAALASFRNGLGISERLVKSYPGGLNSLQSSHNKIGDVLRAQGDLAGALASFRAGFAIAEQLAEGDADCTEWASLPWDFYRESHRRIGHVLKEMDRLAEALESFRAGLAIAERLAQANPGIDMFLYDLWESHNDTGSVLAAQGDLAAALASFRDGLAAAEQTVTVQRANGHLVYQSLPAASWEKIGGVLETQGRSAEALEAYRNGFAVRERFAQSGAPGKLHWHALHELAAACLKLADADPPQARALLTRASELVHDLQQRGWLAPDDGLPAVIAQRIAALPG